MLNTLIKITPFKVVCCYLYLYWEIFPEYFSKFPKYCSVVASDLYKSKVSAGNLLRSP